MPPKPVSKEKLLILLEEARRNLQKFERALNNHKPGSSWYKRAENRIASLKTTIKSIEGELETRK